MKRILYGIPRWSIHQHRRERKLPYVKDEDTRDLKFEDEVFERLYGDDLHPLGKKVDRANEDWAERGHKMCDELGLDVVRPYCKGEVEHAALATAWLMELIEEPLEEAKKRSDQVADLRDAVLGNTVEDQVAEIGAKNLDLSALVEVPEHVPQLGEGGAGGGAAASASERRVEERKRALRRDERLRRIALMAGRMHGAVVEKQRKRTTGSEEMVDITVGGELERILPSELVKFASPRLRLLARRDFIERKLMQYEMRSEESLERGPIVVLLDKSSSMGANDGARDVWASGATLSLLEIAQRQRRPFALVTFANFVMRTTVVRPGGQLPVNDLMIEPNYWTDIPAAVREGVKLIRAGGTFAQADIVLITDGASAGNPEAMKSLAESVNATIYGVGIAAPNVGVWCHHATVLEDLDEDEVARDLIFMI